MRNNGFTLVEALLVLLILSICSFAVIKRPKWNVLRFDLNKIETQCLMMQERAYIKKREVPVHFTAHYVDFDSTRYTYPKGMTCTDQAFHYNAKGNISQAFTVTCSNAQSKKKLVFQLGMGRVREK